MQLSDRAFKALVILQRHVGVENAISMTELFREVFQEEVKDKISSTRELRKVITELRKMGIPVCSEMRNKRQTGYFLARDAQEIDKYFELMEKRALKTLYLISRIKNISLPQYLGQLKLKEV
jgi:L-fucose isomerase-like protein